MMRWFVFFVSLFTIPVVAFCGDFGLKSADFRRGDFDALFKRWCAIIRERPDSHESLAALWLCNHFRDRISDYRNLESVLENALKKPLKNGYCVSAYKQTLREFYLSRGLREKGDSIGAYDGLITEWRFVDGFGEEDGDGAYFIAYEPEKQYLADDKGLLKNTYLKRLSNGVKIIRRWRKPLVHTPPIEDKVVLRSGFRSGGVTYALCQFLLESPQTVIIEVRNPPDWFRLWFNKKEVLRGDRNRNFEPDIRSVAVSAKVGWNTILIKQPSGVVSVYLRDRNGKPLSVRFEKGALFHPVAGVGEVKEDVTPSFFEWLRKEGTAKGAGDLRYLLLLYCAEDGRLVNIAEEMAHEFGEGEDEFSRYFAALGFEAARHCPDAWAANKMRKNLEAALKTAPDFLPAAVSLAHLLADNDKPEEAVKLLKTTLRKVKPQQWALLALAEICDEQGWEREAIEAVKNAERLNPTSPSILSFWADYYQRRGNRKKYLSYRRRYLELYNRDRLEEFLAKEAAHDGDFKPLLRYYLRMWRRYPEKLEYLKGAVEAYINISDYAEALRLLNHALSEFSEWVDAEYVLRNMLLVHRLMGEKDKAAEVAETLFHIALGGGWSRSFPMSRYAAFLRGQDDDFFKPYRLSEEKVKALMAEKITAKDYPRSPILVLLHDAVVEILPDGSANEYHNLILRVLTEEGRMHASRMGSALPDTIRIESITPDGKRYDPTPTLYGLVMQNVQVGGFVRLEGRIDGTNWLEESLGLRGRGACAHLRRITLIFRRPHPTKRASEILKRRGVILPQPLETLNLLLRNIKREPNISIRVTRDGERFVLTAEVRRMEASERLYFLPPEPQIFPTIETFVEKGDWKRGMGRFFSGLRSSGRRVTWLVEQTARTVVGEAKTVYEKVKRLYRYCQTQIRDGYNRNAHATLLEMAGDRQAVFEACLRVLSIKTAVVSVLRVGLSEAPQWERKRLHELAAANYLLVRTENGPLFVDISTRYSPLGSVAPEDQGMPAVVAYPDGRVELIRMPQDPIHLRQRVSLRIDADLTKRSVKFDFILRVFPRSASLKDHFLKLPRLRRLQIFEGAVSKTFRGIKFDQSKFYLQNLQDLEKPAIAHLEGTYDGLMRKRKDGYEVQLCLPSVEIGYRLGGKPQRRYPAYRTTLDYDYQEVTLHLGRYRPVGRLPEAKIVTDFGAYILKCRYEEKSNTIKVMRYFVVLPFRLPPERFGEVLDFCRRVTEAEGLYIVVK